MKPIRHLMILLAMLLFTTGCAGLHNTWKHFTSNITGLSRTITLYGANGEVVRQWKTTAKVEDNGGSCYFLDSNGKAVIVAGQFVIEEH